MTSGVGVAGDHAQIVGSYEVPYARRREEGGTVSLLAEAAAGALADAGLDWRDVDGFAVSSFSLAPDHAIDLCWRLGVEANWLMQDPHGGASALNMLQHARAAIAAGDARTVLVLSGDLLRPSDFARLVEEFNMVTEEELAPLDFGGPNALFAMLMQRHMRREGLDRDTYGAVAVAQRRWAQRNPGAVYRGSLGLDDYLAAPTVAAPLCRYDCVPVVSGADALVVVAPDVAARGPRVAIRSVVGSYNGDDQEGDGLAIGLTALTDRLEREAGFPPAAADVAAVYDDYTVMVLIQLAELGLIPDGDLERFARVELLERDRPVNTSGGQLSAGQAGAAGSLHGLVEATRQLRGQAGERQVADARRALVTGYGMILYRYGACANAALLEVEG
jgi:acetyl-CoA acetyltransferase